VLNRLHTVSEGRGPQRLATILLELAARHGQPDADRSVAIRPTVPREDRASLTGMSLYTASRILSDWEARGVIASRRGRIRPDERSSPACDRQTRMTSVSLAPGGPL
jgi:CRP/FNR family transcriptional regulator, nitrogen oxide reductase regulator